MPETQKLSPLGRHTDLDNLFESVCSLAVAGTKATRASVWYFEADGSISCQRLLDVRTTGYQKGAVIERRTHQVYLDAIVAEGGVLADDARTDNKTSCFNDGYFVENDIYSLLDFLIIDRDGLPAAILCCEQCGGPRKWSEDDIVCLRDLAQSIVETFKYQDENIARRALFTSDLPFSDEPMLMEAAMYWAAKRNARQMPKRSDISPIDMPRPLLPWLAIAAIEYEPFNAFYRLAGTEVVWHYGFDLTGRRITDIASGEYANYIIGLFQSVCENKEAVYSESIFRWNEDGWRRTRRLMMPLASDTPDTVTQVLVVQVWPRENKASTPPRKIEIDTKFLERSLSKRLTLPQLIE
jgi:hypothetical protein